MTTTAPVENAYRFCSGWGCCAVVEPRILSRRCKAFCSVLLFLLGSGKGDDTVRNKLIVGVGHVASFLFGLLSM